MPSIDHRIKKSTGEICMSFDMFKSLKFEPLCKSLGLRAADIREVVKGA